MARYIDADALIEEINSLSVTLCGKELFGELAKHSVVQKINEAPTANVAPIADTVGEMQQRLRFEIINKPSEFLASQATLDFLNGMTHRHHEILDILDQIAKEMLEGEK